MSIEKPGEFRKKLIQGEFREALTREGFEVPVETEAVMVLSAAPSLEEADERKREGNPENTARIKFGAEVLKLIAAKKLNKALDDVTMSDLGSGTIPPLVLNGETEQLPTMLEIAREMGIPDSHIFQIDSGRRGVSNTKTQFEKTLERIQSGDLGKGSHLTLISSSYHVPRVARTAEAQLPVGVALEVLGVPFEDHPFNVFRTVRGEVRRIETYSDKGDIVRSLKKSGHATQE
ncbi:hypothetical protein CL652_01335 [bacterium]|nr:hypothetical protein [bacterium]|tara:strand:+ start:4845 stop:5543 length:699 start_codon:yes stop_codon:yes gene_type:complete